MKLTKTSAAIDDGRIGAGEPNEIFSTYAYIMNYRAC
jgi:hypothetical protein